MFQIYVRRKREFPSERTRVFFEKDWNPLRKGLTLNQHIIIVTLISQSIQDRKKPKRSTASHDWGY